MTDQKYRWNIAYSIRGNLLNEGMSVSLDSNLTEICPELLEEIHKKINQYTGLDNYRIIDIIFVG